MNVTIEYVEREIYFFFEDGHYSCRMMNGEENIAIIDNDGKRGERVYWLDLKSPSRRPYSKSPGKRLSIFTFQEINK